MKVLYVIDSLAPGGAETSLAEMAPGLHKLDVELHVLPLGKRVDLRERLEAGGACVHPGPSRAGRLARLGRVLSLARELQPDLIHTTLYEANISGRIAGRIAGIPVTSSLVSDSYSAPHYAEGTTLKLHAARALDAATALAVARFHSLTAAIARDVAPRLGVPQSKITIIPRGRDPLGFAFQPPGVRSKVRRKLGIPEQSPVILALARHEPPKGLHHLVKALPTISRTHPQVVTLIAGKDGRSTTSLTEVIAETGLDIRLLGARSDVADLLAAADLFCFPSEREGFGGVLIEAMAVGCPIVASRIPATVEVLSPRASQPIGRLVPPGDANAFAEAIADTLADQSLKESMRVRGYQHFLENYTIGRVTQQMASFFESAAAGC